MIRSAALGLALISTPETAGVLWPVDEPILIVVFAIPTGWLLLIYLVLICGALAACARFFSYAETWSGRKIIPSRSTNR